MRALIYETAATGRCGNQAMCGLAQQYEARAGVLTPTDVAIDALSIVSGYHDTDADHHLMTPAEAAAVLGGLPLEPVPDVLAHLGWPY